MSPIGTAEHALWLVHWHFEHENPDQLELLAELYHDDIVWEVPTRRAIYRGKREVLDGRHGPQGRRRHRARPGTRLGRRPRGSTLQPVPAGESGEICARAPYVMDRYHGLPDATARTLAGDWLHTGDIGFMGGDGYVYLLDRKNDMIISGGMNVYTTEVEQVISACTGVAQVAVAGVPHPDWGEAVVAFVVPDDDFDQGLLEQTCRTELAAYKRPKACRRVDDLPVTSVGKIDKKLLKASWKGW